MVKILRLFLLGLRFRTNQGPIRTKHSLIRTKDFGIHTKRGPIRTKGTCMHTNPQPIRTNQIHIHTKQPLPIKKEHTAITICSPNFIII